MAPPLDAHVARVLDHHPSTATDSDDEDALIAALEDEDEGLDAFREQRLQQLHNELARAKALRNEEHGTYKEIKEEKEVMDITTKTKLCVIHFFKPDFGRCGVMDSHLEQLAPLHISTRFLRLNVTNAPFLVTKLKVQVLPCVIAFVDGVGVDRIIGFEGLSHNPDKFDTRDLEARLLTAGVLERAKIGEGDGRRERLRQRQLKEDEECDEDDWD
ncbi:thioredoxin-like protein [Aulographum hederae CBS 113979]|uniref:Thioredoxin-like protein n=1 Tax=Aulographum hederae CBS 113979 TaxID=1176131 RepID=A0A6G1GYC9_9PEZI|nr:thioredoxin-like protein [Aulographum hederae CBS 113979]